jgi:type IV secretion system protein VirB1
MLSVAAAAGLAMACIPTVGPRPVVSPDVLLSVARVESGFDPLAIHDNRTGEALHPASKADAVALARRLIAAGHSIDLGLMQITSGNLGWLGLSVTAAFDPCASIRAGSRVLLAGYDGGTTTAEQQAAILRSLSRYNTGNAMAGLHSYVPLVLAAAEKTIPALRLAGVEPYAPAPMPPPPAERPAGEPPDWDVTAHAEWEATRRTDPAPGANEAVLDAVMQPPETGTGK